MTSPTSAAIPSLPIWRALQALLLIIGIVQVGLLMFFPYIGLHLFWNIIIPAAPAIVVIIPGVWRNICPMASIGLLPRHLGISERKHISKNTHGYFAIAGLTALLLIVPLRHLTLNTNGYATAIMLIIAAATAFIVGRRYEWKSAWCSGLCPIHPVEKLYGSTAAVTVPNAHCTSCEKCHAPCPDSTKSMSPLVTNKNKIETIVGISMVGGFFGYVLGWFHVPDYVSPIGFLDITNAFLLPLGGFFASLGVFLVLYNKASKTQKALLVSFFATAAVSCYYWYRIPMLFGWGVFPGDGMLINLTTILPHWFPIASQLITTSFFFWFMMLRNSSNKSWSNRPAFSTEALAK